MSHPLLRFPVNRILPAVLVLALLTSCATIALAAKPSPGAAADRLAASVEARARQDYETAIREATEALTLHPQSSEAYLARAFAHFGAKNQAAAAADFKAAVTADPTSARAYLYRGDLAYRLIEGDFAACEQDYATVARLEPDYPGFRAYTAELYLYMKKPDRVITEAVLGLTSEPHSPIHKINLAHGLAFAGQKEAALALYRAIAQVEIGHGRRGAAFALGDFATLKRKGVEYPVMAELTVELTRLVEAAGDSRH